jgi:hypothetical protein
MQMLRGQSCYFNYAITWKKKEILFRIVEVRSGVRDLLRKQGMEDITGPVSRITTIQHLVDEF